MSRDPYQVDEAHGLGSEDNPTFEGMHGAAAHIVGATVEAARQVWTRGGRCTRRTSPEASTTRCPAGRAGSASTTTWPWRSSGCSTTVPSGWPTSTSTSTTGTASSEIFWDDPRVLTISLHETGQMLFPGTGFPQDTGGPKAPGSAVNVALPPGTADAGWLRAFHAVVPPLLREFAPDVLVTQHGCDSHIEDPLAHLMLTVDGQRAAYLALHDLAHEVCDGKWVVTGGGGYAVVDVVPRAWTHLLAIVGREPARPAHEYPGGLARTTCRRCSDGWRRSG